MRVKALPKIPKARQRNKHEYHLQSEKKQGTIDPKTVTTWFPSFLAAHDLPPVHFHSLRHTNASLLIAAHVPVTAVSGRLGHAKTSTTTDIYAGFIRSADAAAADALTNVFERIREENHA